MSRREPRSPQQRRGHTTSPPSCCSWYSWAPAAVTSHPLRGHEPRHLHHLQHLQQPHLQSEAAAAGWRLLRILRYQIIIHFATITSIVKTVRLFQFHDQNTERDMLPASRQCTAKMISRASTMSQIRHLRTLISLKIKNVMFSYDRQNFT